MKGVGLIVPDVHEKVNVLERVLSKYESQVEWVLFLGDFLDNWDGLTERTHLMARWLMNNLSNPKYTFLMGNHDMHYAYPVPGIICGGYTMQKQLLLNSYLKQEHWKHFKLMEWVTIGDQEWLCSHAGLHHTLLHPVTGLTKEYLVEAEDRAIKRLSYGEVDPFVAVGNARGGNAAFGGVNWLDWNYEFSPIDGLNQIVGHTHGKDVRWSDVPLSKNVCIDTGFKHIILTDGAQMQILETK